MAGALERRERAGEVGARRRPRSSGAACRRASTATASSSGRVDVGPRRTMSSPPATSIPNRLPCRAVRNPNAAAAANATSDLLALAGSEVHARGTIDDGPRLQLAVGFGRSDLRRDGTGGEVPVDPPSVVAGFVPARAGDLRSRSALAAEELAAQQAVEPTRHEQLEPAQLGRLAGDGRDAFGGRTRLATLAHAFRSWRLRRRAARAALAPRRDTRLATSLTPCPEGHSPAETSPAAWASSSALG